jgi:pimeloyl-ACP methyl ester carboxylesterase
MKTHFIGAISAIALAFATGAALAAPAIDVLGKDFAFPNTIEGVPAKLSDFSGLQINSFTTSDGVKLSYWEAGTGEPLVFVPGWSANGAEFFNVMYLLKDKYRVIVLDPRNQGLSEKVTFGNRISRYGADLKELIDVLGADKVDLVGWSMGAAITWSYIDTFGTGKIRKAAFIDEPISIYTHEDWSEEQRLNAGGMTTSAERMVANFTQGVPTNTMVVYAKGLAHVGDMTSLYYQNSEAFAGEFVKTDPAYTSLVLFDHAVNDWSDVVSNKIDVPAAIFTGEYSDNLPSQRWLASVIPGSELFVYTKEEEGDHTLHFKNPIKFTKDLTDFLTR